jgi:hypothetical protein
MRIRIFEHGKRFAIDEAGTKTDGTYALDLLVKKGGERIDIAAQPMEDSPLQGERVENLLAEPGASLVQNFHIAAGKGISGTLIGVLDRSIGSGHVTVAAVPLPEWERILGEAKNGYPEPAAVLGAAVATDKTKREFNLPALPDTRCAVVSATAGYAVLDPPVVEPGTESVFVRLTPVVNCRYHVYDADTMDAVSGIVRLEVMGDAEDDRYKRAEGPGTGFGTLLRWDERARNKDLRIRVTAAGYREHVEVLSGQSRWYRPIPRRFLALYRDDKKSATIRFLGAGATACAAHAEGSAFRHFDGPNAMSFRVPIVVQRRDDKSVRALLPRGPWSMAIRPTPDAPYQFYLPAVDVAASDDYELRVDVPAQVPIALDWPAEVERGFVNLVAHGRLGKWTVDQEGVHRCDPAAGNPAEIRLVSGYKLGDELPREVTLPPGSWKFVWWVQLSGEKGAWKDKWVRELTVDVAAGSAPRLELSKQAGAPVRDTGRGSRPNTRRTGTGAR